jgi:hydroxymethylglutaryl-CoA reductase
MALHARCVAVTAGARGIWVERVANLLVKAGHVKVEKAKEIIASLSLDELSAAAGTEG